MRYIALFVSLFIGICTSSYANASTLTWESDYGDYIGQGKYTTFDTSNGDKINPSNASANTISIQLSSFAISWMNAAFSAENGKALTDLGKFYPAKRNAFRDGYNGIDISGDGRGCNTILGGFYVHEYTMEGGALKSAAIDFVQYCEGNTSKGMYGSFRHNSNIASYCSAGSCKKVKDLFGIVSPPIVPPTTDIVTPPANPEPVRNPTNNNPPPSQSYPATNNNPPQDNPDEKILTQFEDDASVLLERLSDELPIFFDNCDLDPFECDNEFAGDMRKGKRLLSKKTIQINKMVRGKQGNERTRIYIKGIEIALADVRKERARGGMDSHKDLQTSIVLISLESLKLLLETGLKLK